MARSEYRYDASPGLAHAPLNVEEADAIIASGGRRFAKDVSAVMHFVRRVAATLSDNNLRLQRLEGELQNERLARNDRLGQNSGLSPMQMMAYLSDDMIRDQYRGSYARDLNRLKQLIDEATETRAAAISDLQKVRRAVNAVLGDEAIEAGVRNRLLELLRTLPDEIPTLAPDYPRELRTPDGRPLDTVAEVNRAHAALPGRPPVPYPPGQSPAAAPAAAPRSTPQPGQQQSRDAAPTQARQPGPPAMPPPMSRPTPPPMPPPETSSGTST